MSFLHAQRQLARGLREGSFMQFGSSVEDGGLGWRARGASWTAARTRKNSDSVLKGYCQHTDVCGANITKRQETQARSTSEYDMDFSRGTTRCGKPHVRLPISSRSPRRWPRLSTRLIYLSFASSTPYSVSFPCYKARSSRLFFPR